MGVIGGPVRADAHLAQNIDHPLLGLHLGAVLVAEDHLGHLVAYGHHRIQGGHGVLEDHRDLVASDVLDLFLAHGHNISVFIDDGAALHLAGLRHQPKNTQGGGRLTRARLPHQAQGLTGLHRQGHAVHGAYIPLFRGEVDRQVFNSQ